MTNYEQYKEQITRFTRLNINFGFNKNTKEIVDCGDFDCEQCLFSSPRNLCSGNKLKWADEEYAEPEVDWTNVPIDTKILVKDSEDDKWLPRYFAGYKDKRVRTWDNGATSFSTKSIRSCSSWDYAKLAEEE